MKTMKKSAGERYSHYPPDTEGSNPGRNEAQVILAIFPRSLAGNDLRRQSLKREPYK